MQIIRIDSCEICCGTITHLIKIIVSEENFYVCTECVADLMSAPFSNDQNLIPKEIK